MLCPGVLLNACVVAGFLMQVLITPVLPLCSDEFHHVIPTLSMSLSTMFLFTACLRIWICLCRALLGLKAAPQFLNAALVKSGACVGALLERPSVRFVVRRRGHVFGALAALASRGCNRESRYCAASSESRMLDLASQSLGVKSQMLGPRLDPNLRF